MKRLYLSLLLTLSVIGLFGQGAIYTRNIIIDKATPVLFLKGNGGIIDFNTGSITLTQSVNKLTIAGGTLDLTTLPTVNNVTFKTSLSLTATDVGLGNVTNESKATMFTSPMITGTPTIAGYVPTSRTINGHDLTGNVSVTTTDLSLQNVTNESKATMFTSPTFTNTATIPTPFTLGTVSMTTTGTKLNYLTSATGTTGTTSTNIVFSTSPALTTPTVVTSIAGDATFAAFNTVSTALSIGGAATTLTVGGTPTTTITHSYSANVTANGATKTVNIGTSGNTGSTTNVNIGSSNGGTTTINSSTLALGTGNITMTGSLGQNGSPLTKGWFIDISSTNMPTVGENALTTIFVALRPDTVQHTSNFTLGASDVDKEIFCTENGPQVITIPLNLSIMAISSTLNFYGSGTGPIIFKGAAGVHIFSSLDSIASGGAGDVIGMKKRGANNYWIYGPLED